MVGEKKRFSCDRYGSGFTSYYKHSLLRHIKNVHEGDVKKAKGGLQRCQEVPWCNYQTTCYRNLRRHIQAKHRYTRSKKCCFCDYQTTSTEKLVKHKRVHKGEAISKLNCSVCNLSFRDKEGFENHLNERHPAGNDFDQKSDICA